MQSRYSLTLVAVFIAQAVTMDRPYEMAASAFFILSFS